MSGSNLEIKARCADLDAARRSARRVATSRVGFDEQVDTYFRVPRGRLKLRESSLSGGQLIPYLRPDAREPQRSDYQVLAVPDPPALRALLERLLGVHRVVRKRREIYLYENVRIHLDVVDGLGDFLELEAVFDGSADAKTEQEPKVAFLMRALGVEAADLIDLSYEGMLAAEARPA